MNAHDRHGATLLGLLLGLILLGDYLMLSVSRLALGTANNWILLVAVAQLLFLAMAVPAGWLRGTRPGLPMFGMLGLGALMLVHLARVDGEVSDYGVLKTLAFFGIALPGFLIGAMLGERRALPFGPPTALLMAAPLLSMCAVAAATDPDQMTIARFGDLAVFAGVLVLPVHQALAFSLAKLALWSHAQTARPARRRFPFIVLAATCVGLAVLSGSRAYLLAAALGLGVQWTAGRRGMGRWGMALLAMVVVAPVLAYTLAPEAVRAGLDPEEFAGSLSMVERLDLWTAAAGAFWEAPLLGHGPGGFAAWVGWHDRVYPHNIVLEVLSELGLAGAACLLAVVLPAAARILGLCLRRERPTEVQLFAVGFAAFAAAGALGVADLVRNHFFFLAAGMATTACRPQSAAAAAPHAVPAAVLLPDAR